MKDNERRVYEYILQQSREGVPPSIREICAALGIRSTSTAARYVNTLVDMGLIEKNDGHNRSIRPSGSNSVTVPVIGTVTAGSPITAFEDVTGHITVTPERHYSGQLFALRVKGESMIEAAICDGDYIVAEQCETARNGEIAVVMVNGGEAAVKRFYKENGGYRLQPENSRMEPIYTDECSVLGRVVAVIRYI